MSVNSENPLIKRLKFINNWGQYFSFMEGIFKSIFRTNRKLFFLL